MTSIFGRPGGPSGGGILADALGLIETTSIVYFQYGSRALNKARVWVNTYQAGVPLEASVQAVNRDTYHDLGLDFQRNYVNLFMPRDGIDLSRDVAGDRFYLPEQDQPGVATLFQVESMNRWYLMDGWVEMLCVQVSLIETTVTGIQQALSIEFNSTLGA